MGLVSSGLVDCRDKERELVCNEEILCKESSQTFQAAQSAAMRLFLVDPAFYGAYHSLN